MEKQDRKRITLEMPATARERMDELMLKTEAVSVAEVIRRAIMAYDLIVESQNAGGQIVIRGSDGNEKILKLL